MKMSGIWRGVMKRNIAYLLAFCTLLFAAVFSFNFAFAEEEFVIPDHIKETISRYKKIIDDNHLKIYYNGVFWTPASLSELKGDFGSYYFDFHNLSYHSIPVWYRLNTYGQSKKSMRVTLDKEMTNDLLVEFITLSIAVIDPSTDFSEAKPIARNFFYSFTGKGHSNALPVGDCMLTLSNELYGDIISLYVTYNSEINVITDKSQYKQLPTNEAQSKLHDGEKVYVTGTVEQQCKMLADTSDQVEYVIFSSGGHRYSAYFSYPYLPVQFEAGQVGLSTLNRTEIMRCRFS